MWLSAASLSRCLSLSNVVRSRVSSSLRFVDGGLTWKDDDRDTIRGKLPSIRWGLKCEEWILVREANSVSVPKKNHSDESFQGKCKTITLPVDWLLYNPHELRLAKFKESHKGAVIYVVTNLWIGCLWGAFGVVVRDALRRTRRWFDPRHWQSSYPSPWGR